MNELRLFDYLEHIEQAASRAIEFAGGHDLDSFKADVRTQQAIIMNLIIIGEAAARILSSSPDFAADHPEVAWRQIRGMRNRMAHGYFDIDLNTVWDTIQTALPVLLGQIRRIPRD